MKRIVFLAMAMVLLITGQSFAAGSWVSAPVIREGYLQGSLNMPIGYEFEFTSDASDASVPDKEVYGITGYCTAIDVEFDGTATPTSVIVVLKSANGLTLETSATLTASGRVVFDAPQALIDGFTLSITAVGNSKKAKVILYVF